jgi:hypothetical protein
MKITLHSLRTVLATVVLLASGSTLIVPESAATCLKYRLIDSTKVIDAKTIDFTMKDGRVYRNNLPVQCNSLKFAGFVSGSRFGEICDFQPIRMLQSQELCSLGRFQAPLKSWHNLN